MRPLTFPVAAALSNGAGPIAVQATVLSWIVGSNGACNGGKGCVRCVQGGLGSKGVEKWRLSSGLLQIIALATLILAWALGGRARKRSGTQQRQKHARKSDEQTDENPQV